MKLTEIKSNIFARIYLLITLLFLNFSLSAQVHSCAWTTAANSRSAKAEGQGSVVNGKIYAFGGFIQNLQVTADTEIYDPETDVWTLGAPMPKVVTHAPVVVVGNSVWLIAGFEGRHPGVAIADVQIYNTITNSWSVGPSLPQTRAGGAAALVDSRVHYFGGLFADRMTDAQDHWYYDLNNPNAGWQTAAPLPNPRNHLSAAVIGNLIYAIGGQFGHDGPSPDTDLVQTYNFSSNSWNLVQALPGIRSHFEPGTMVYNNKILIAGGTANEDAYDDIIEYNPISNSWSHVCDLPDKLLGPVTKIVHDRMFLINGGINNAGQPTSNTRWIPVEPEFNSDFSTNLALGKATSQSSTLSHAINFDSSNAVDGNNNGNASANSITHTNNEQNAWWEIDLGNIYDLSGITLWNRTDCCAERLTNFHVLVSDVPFNNQGLAATINQNGVTDLHFTGTAGRKTDINLNRIGRYVRVQLSNMNTLQLAEVQIYGVERSSNSVTLYQNCNYNGANVSLSVGQYQDIASVGLVNDEVSSLRVPAGLQVTLFEHNNFGGAAITLTSDNNCLINNNFNDQASSIIIQAASSSKSLQEEAALAIQSLSMYPNPARELLNIDLISEIDKSTSIQIIDFSGKVMVNYNANITEGANHLELDVNGLSSGVYFVRSTNGKINQKLIVK